MTRPAELSTAMEEYLKITRIQLAGSDLMVETITVRLMNLFYSTCYRSTNF